MPETQLSLKPWFPCKKLRRSGRLEMKEKQELQNKIITDSPLGYFDTIPLELKFLIFTFIPVHELSMLTITSKAMRNLIEVYRATTMAKDHLLPKPMVHSLKPVSDHAWYIRQFKKLGLLMKRSTCLYATRDRLKIIQQFLHKFLCSIHSSCTDPKNCIALVCYGQFMHKLIAGWDDKECARVLDTIGTDTLMLRNMENIIKCKPGSFSTQELHCRLFFRRVFIDQCEQSTDMATWLALLLKPYPMVYQARILFLLFGPMKGDEVQWYEMTESTPNCREQSVLCFGDLANAFRVLHHFSKDWNEDDVISVLEELTNSPDEWISENVAHLLFLCGESITQKVLNSKAVNGRITELASLVTSLCLVCIQHEHSLSWVVSVVMGICMVMEKVRERISFLYAIIDTFKEVILDMHEFNDSEDSRDPELQHMLEAQAEFSKELVLVAFRENLN